jgi:hypothetical protein
MESTHSGRMTGKPEVIPIQAARSGKSRPLNPLACVVALLDMWFWEASYQFLLAIAVSAGRDAPIIFTIF